MKFLNSVLETLKKYWYFFVILTLTVVVLAVGFVENSKMAGLVNSVKDTIENYKKQVNTMDKLSNKRSKKDKETTQTYQERAKQIQEKRDADLAKVNARKIELVDELKDKSAEELAQKMKDEFKL